MGKRKGNSEKGISAFPRNGAKSFEGGKRVSQVGMSVSATDYIRNENG